MGSPYSCMYPLLLGSKQFWMSHALNEILDVKLALNSVKSSVKTLSPGSDYAMYPCVAFCRYLVWVT